MIDIISMFPPREMYEVFGRKEIGKAREARKGFCRAPAKRRDTPPVQSSAIARQAIMGVTHPVMSNDTVNALQRRRQRRGHLASTTTTAVRFADNADSQRIRHGVSPLALRESPSHRQCRPSSSV